MPVFITIKKLISFMKNRGFGGGHGKRHKKSTIVMQLINAVPKCALLDENGYGEYRNKGFMDQFQEQYGRLFENDKEEKIKLLQLKEKFKCSLDNIRKQLDPEKVETMESPKGKILLDFNLGQDVITGSIHMIAKCKDGVIGLGFNEYERENNNGKSKKPDLESLEMEMAFYHMAIGKARGDKVKKMVWCEVMGGVWVPFEFDGKDLRGHGNRFRENIEKYKIFMEGKSRQNKSDDKTEDLFQK